jgi:Sec-independent protein translocase protein TatA
MELFGIGPMELVFIILLVVIIFGPKDIVKTGKTVGDGLNKFVRSDTWKTINQTSRALKNLPTRLMQQTGLDELENSANEEMAKVDMAIKRSVEPIALLEPAQSVIPVPDIVANFNLALATAEKSPAEAPTCGNS